MPSFTSRHYTPERLQPLSKLSDDSMDDIIYTRSAGPKNLSAHFADSLNLVPSDGSLLDYFDLPSPPSTPHRPTHSLSYSSLNSLPSSPPRSAANSPPSSSPSSSPPPLYTSPHSTTTSSPPRPRWPSHSQRIHRLPVRPRSRSTSSSSTSSSASSSSSLLGADGDTDMLGLGLGVVSGGVTVRPTRRTPYYPPNASRSGAAERSRAYMNRGPHYVPNWTPLASLPRHVQLQIEERMVRFTAD